MEHEINFSNFLKIKKFAPVWNHTSWHGIPNFRSCPLYPGPRQLPKCWIAFPLKIFKIHLKNLPHFVVKFNHKTLLGCFLTFPVFSVLTTCSWSLAHLVGLSDDMLLITWSDDTFLIVNLFGRAFALSTNGGSTSLISGLSSNFSAHGKIAPMWCNASWFFLSSNR